MQQNVKRLLAYSSIAHAGYILVAFAAGKQVGISAAIFYTASYAAMNVGAFAVVSHFASAGEKYVTLDDYAGLGRRSPMLAAILTIFLLSLIGIPVTGGFFAKFYVFSAALQSNLVGLTIMVGGGYEAIIKGRLKFFQIQCAQRVPGLPLSQSAPCITAG